MKFHEAPCHRPPRSMVRIRFLIAFTMSVDDFVISYFTAGSSVSTLAMEIYSMARKKVTPEINAVSTLLFVVVLLLLVAVNLREARQAKTEARRKYGTMQHSAGTRART
mgnify:CR=1 FL=1